MGETKAMDTTEEVKFSLRVLIDKEKEKVLFAEVSSDFADTLISFLTLPLGTIVRLLVKHYGDEAPVIGSLNALYKSLEDNPATNFWTKEGKLMLLHPRNSFESHLRELRINIDDTEPIKYFVCEDRQCTMSRNPCTVSMYYNSDKCVCGRSMNSEISYEHENKIGSGVFTKDTASFIISDDLQLLPNLFGSGLQILKKLGFDGTFAVEERALLVGLKEIMDLLKLSFISSTPLTDLVFHNTVPIFPVTVNSGPRVVRSSETSTSMTMTLNIVLQKSSGKVVVAQTREDFVDFLFSLLSIPLGRALSLLGNDSSYASIHSLCKSMACLTGDVCGLKIQNMFDKTELPPMYLSKHQPLPLSQQQIPKPLYCFDGYDGKERNLCLTPVMKPAKYLNDRNVPVSVEDPKGLQGSYVKGPTMFMVTDDLVVKPISTISGLSILSSLKISLSDVEEHVVEIGIDEALNILKACLFSTSVLSNCLNPLFMRQIKQEK